MHLVTGALGNQQEKDYAETIFDGSPLRRSNSLCGDPVGIRSFPAYTNAAGVNWKSHGVRTMKDSIAAIDPQSRRCVLIGAGDAEYLKRLFGMGLILVPISGEDAAKALHEQHQDIFTLNEDPSDHVYPTISPPGIESRIEAAFLAVAFQGKIGLATRLTLMHPSTDISAGSCAKYGAVVLSRLAAASLAALLPQRSAQIQQELAEYLSSNFECP